MCLFIQIESYSLRRNGALTIIIIILKYIFFLQEGVITKVIIITNHDIKTNTMTETTVEVDTGDDTNINVIYTP